MPKKIKDRPPRLYRKGEKTYYLNNQGKRVLVKDVNLTINNIIQRVKRNRAPVGAQVAKSISKNQLEKEALIRQATINELRLKHKEETDLMNLRIKQIKEEAIAKNEKEALALRAEHERERREQQALRAIEDEKAKLEIQRLKVLAEEKQKEINSAQVLQSQHDGGPRRLINEAAAQTVGAIPRDDDKERLLREIADGEKRLIQYQHEVERKQLKDTAIKYETQLREIEEAKQRTIAQRLGTRRINAELNRQMPHPPSTKPSAQPSAEGRDEKSIDSDIALHMPLSQPYELSLPSELSLSSIKEEQIGNGCPSVAEPTRRGTATPPIGGCGTCGNKLHVSSLPHGLSEDQINNIMNDEDRFLKTVASDEIADLKEGAKTIDNEYGEFGFIVNLDKRNEDKKEHWTAVYVDTDNEKILFYYDPFGDPPTETINNGLKDLVKHLNLPYYLRAEYNMKKNQNLNSNRCGIHCMQFLRDMFNGKSTDEATEHNEADAIDFQRSIKYI